MAKKKQIKNKVPSKVWTKYKLEGDKLTKKQMCPKCGEGYFLAEHKNRSYCGKCHYTHFQSKKEEPKIEVNEEHPKEEK